MSSTHGACSAPECPPAVSSGLQGASTLEKNGPMSGDSALPQLVAGLKRRIDQLSAYIDSHLEDLDPADYARLGTLQGQLVSRMSRLNKEMAEQGTGAGALATAINDALDQLGTEWKIAL